MHIRVYILALIGTCPLSSLASPRAYSQFRSWYPQFGVMFEEILETQCQDQYNVYLYGTSDNTTILPNTGSGPYVRYIQPTIDCILNKTNEYAKAALSVSQMILGLAPTILSFMSASTSETAILAVIGKRPVLVTLLCWGSPSIYVSRAFEYVDPQVVLADRKGRYRQNWGSNLNRGKRWRSLQRSASTIAEYMIAFGAIANVATISWDLATRSVCMINPHFIYSPAAWTIVSLFPHLLGAIALQLRIRRGANDSAHGTPPTAHPKSISSRTMKKIGDFARSNLDLMSTTEQGKFHARLAVETPIFLVLAWLSSLSSVAHLAWGTIIFSGMLFIGPYDGFIIFARLTASCVVCRVVLMFELAGLREAYNNTLTDEATNRVHVQEMTE